MSKSANHHVTNGTAEVTNNILAIWAQFAVRKRSRISELAALSQRDGRYLELEAFRPLSETVGTVLDAVWPER